MTAPCDGCCRVHRGPRCSTITKTVITVSLPESLALRFRDAIAPGHRSTWLARLIDEHLEDV